MPSLEEAHRVAQQRITDAVAARLAQALAGMPDSPETFEIYNRAAAGLVRGGQRRSAQLSFAYLAQISPEPLRPKLDRALAGVAVDRTSPVTRSPVLRLWRLLGEGMAAREALIDATSYAGQLSSQDLAAAMRGGLDEAASVSSAKIVGWRKELGPTACDWCQLVGAERIYSSADSVPFHANDTCGVSPVLEGEEA